MAIHTAEGVTVSFDEATNKFEVTVTRTYNMELEPRPFKDEKDMTEALEEIAYEAAEAVDEYVGDVAEELGAIEGTEKGFLSDED